MLVLARRFQILIHLPRSPSSASRRSSHSVAEINIPLSLRALSLLNSGRGTVSSTRKNTNFLPLNFELWNSRLAVLWIQIRVRMILGLPGSGFVSHEARIRNTGGKAYNCDKHTEGQEPDPIWGF